MSKIVIDARESGTSTGRYIDKLIEYLHKIASAEHEFIVLTKAHRLEFMSKIAPKFQVIETPYEEFTFGEQLGFKKQIESLKPDLVHFGMVQQPIWYNGRVVTTMHDLITTQRQFKNPSTNPMIFSIKQEVYRWVNKKAARKSQLIITPTEYVKKDVVNFTHISPDKITVTLEAADFITETAQPVESLKNKRFIMYIGRPMPHKNLGRLMDAFQLLQQTHPDLYLVLAGKKDPRYEAHERAASARGIKNIIFTGFISDSELKWLYQNTACYVFPSLSEGFGLPPLEAMIHGAPVAASNYTCIPEVLGDAAEYFDPLDVQGIGETIERVISDENLRKDLIKRGKAQAARYSWQRMAEQTLEVYNRALS